MIDLWKTLLDQFGTEESTLRKVITYLQHYGYLKGGIVEIITNLAKAIIDLKTRAGLIPTQSIDTPLVDLVSRPRCGCTDALRDSAEARWRKTDLKYYIAAWVNGLSQQDQADLIALAWNDWMVNANIKLTRVNSQQGADIVISTGSGQAQGFDGPSGTLAWAYLPSGNDQQLLMRFDIAESWMKDLSQGQRGILMRNVACHEFGHLLGLEHSTISSALMAPFYSPSIVSPQQNNDIPRIQTLYGPAIAVPPPPPPPPPPTGGLIATISVYQDGRISIPGYSVTKIP